MAVINPAITPLEWAYETATQSSPVDGTWYEIANYTGSGLLSAIGLFWNTEQTTGEVRITIDGTATTLSKSNMQYFMAFCGAVMSAAGTYYGTMVVNLGFASSMKVEMRRDGSTNAFTGMASYGKA